MRIAFLGGTGFISGYTALEAESRGHEIILIHRGHTASRLNKAKEVLIGRSDTPKLKRALEEFKPDVVIDTYAMTGKDAEDLTKAVDAPFIVFSSQDVYAQFGSLHGHPPEVNEELVTENSPLTVPYAFRGFEGIPGGDMYDKKEVERVFKDSGNPCIVLRLPAVYGQGDPQRRFGAIIERLANKEALLHIGGAKWRWTHGHVKDIAYATILAAEKQQGGYHIFNLGEEKAPNIQSMRKAIQGSLDEDDSDWSDDDSWESTTTDFGTPLTTVEGDEDDNDWFDADSIVSQQMTGLESSFLIVEESNEQKIHRFDENLSFRETGKALGSGGASKQPYQLDSLDGSPPAVHLQLKNEGDSGEIRELKHESEILSSIRNELADKSDSFVEIFGTTQGDDGQLNGIIVEACDKCTALSSLAPKERGKKLLVLGEALSDMHKLGYLHRDIKPDNVMLSQKGNLVLTDFGIATRAGVPVSPNGTVVTDQALQFEQKGTALFFSRKFLTNVNNHLFDEKPVTAEDWFEGYKQNDVQGFVLTCYTVLTGKELPPYLTEIRNLHPVIHQQKILDTEPKIESDNPAENAFFQTALREDASMDDVLAALQTFIERVDEE